MTDEAGGGQMGNSGAMAAVEQVNTFYHRTVGGNRVVLKLKGNPL